jgi:hypothetical protein
MKKIKSNGIYKIKDTLENKSLIELANLLVGTGTYPGEKVQQMSNPDMFEEVGVEEDKKEAVPFDLNNDGVFDEKDTSIAGKTLAQARKKKNKK